MSLVDEAQRSLLHDLVTSFLTALLTIGAVLALTTRSLTLGALAMLPNVLPVSVVFGIMGWCDEPVDIGTVMTASVAIGICVDGTVHFLKWFRIERENGRSVPEALETSYRHCGWALVQSAAICGLGLMAFAFSDFVPTRRFAWIMSAILVLGLIGDLVLLPALLAMPFFKWFSGGKRKRSSSDHHDRSGQDASGGVASVLPSARETLLIPFQRMRSG
jgi:predicted RND superfamily exporter protein